MRRTTLAAALLAALASIPAAAEDPAAGAPPLVTEAVLAAPVAEVWKVFTTSEGWKALGVAQAQVDLKVGGKILSRYEAGGTLGDEKTIENTILAFEPERMLAIKATKAPAGFPFPAEVRERTWSVLTFHDLGDGRTRLTVRGHGYGTDVASQKLRAFFEKGNALTLDRLAKNLAKDAATMSASPTAPIEASTLVAASPDKVFTAWTTAAGIEAFLGVKARVELALGGPFELEFGADFPVGQRGSEGCTVLSWLPGRMFSFTWNAPPTLPHARKYYTVVVVELEPEGPGATRVRLTHHGFAEKAAAQPDHAEEWAKVRAYFAKAWPNVLGAMRKHFEAR